MQPDPTTIDSGELEYKRQMRRIRRGGCAGCGCASIGILLGVGGGAVGILVAILAVFSPNTLSTLMGGALGVPMPQTRAIVGDASNFDPFAAVTQAQAMAGENAELVSIRVVQVRADGTQNLNADYKPPLPDTTYKFIRKVAPPTNAPPVGAGGNTGGEWHETVTIRAYKPGSRSHTTRTGGGVSFSYDFVNDGFSLTTDSPSTSKSDTIVDPPTCSIAEFWKAGIDAGYPKDAVATVEYDASGYRLSLIGYKSLSFDKACKVKK
jgi:hypothetical protein